MFPDTGLTQKGDQLDQSTRLSYPNHALTTVTAGISRVVRAVAPIRPVHKSPSLTADESWLSTVVSTVEFAVPRTICFQVHPSDVEGVMVRTVEVGRQPDGISMIRGATN
jgi:hypothetical protein